ncbi:hypothetical protein MASR2M44_14690 [Bacteroidota bacterium]
MKGILNAILFVLMCISVLAQDVLYTNSYAHKAYLNPALIGRDGSGIIRSSLMHRNLFQPLHGPSYHSSFAADYSLCNSVFALGMLAGNETQGNNFFQTNHAALQLGIRRILNREWTANAGFQFGVVQQTIDWNEFVFSDQIHPIFGSIYPSAMDGTRISSSLSPDISAGFDLTRFAYGKNGSKSAFNLGFAVHHITNNSDIGILSNYILPRRYTAHFSFIKRKNPATIAQSWEFSGRYDRQLASNHGMMRVNYFFMDELGMGIGLRSSFHPQAQLVSPTFAIQYNHSEQLNFYLSYEASLGNSSFTNAGNTFEIGLIFRSKEAHCPGGSFLNGKGSGGRMICPVFNKSKVAPGF